MSADSMRVSSSRKFLLPIESATGTPQRRRQLGLSLIELVMFIVVVSTGLLGLLSVFNSAVQHSADPMVQKQMLAIAESMLEEIQLQDFANPSGGFTPTSHACATYRTERASYDDIDDYNGIANCPIYSLADTQPVDALAGYNVTVAIDSPASLNDLNNSPDVKRIGVTVSHGNDTITLTGYRTHYGG